MIRISALAITKIDVALMGDTCNGANSSH